MARRPVERKHSVALVRRVKRPDLVEVTLIEFRQRPFAPRQLLRRDHFVRACRHLEKEVIRVAQDDRPAKASEAVEDCCRLVTALRHITEDDPVVNPEALQLGQHGVEGESITVNVRDQSVRSTTDDTAQPDSRQGR